MVSWQTVCCSCLEHLLFIKMWHVMSCHKCLQVLFLSCPSCTFIARWVASPKSLCRDLCNPFYVVDDNKWRERTQIILWERDRKDEKDRVCERETSDRRVQRLNLVPTVNKKTTTHAIGVWRTSFSGHPAIWEKRFTWTWTHPLATWFIVFHPQEDICVSFFSFFLFQFSLVAGYDSSSPCPASPTGSHLQS